MLPLEWIFIYFKLCLGNKQILEWVKLKGLFRQCCLRGDFNCSSPVFHPSQCCRWWVFYLLVSTGTSFILTHQCGQFSINIEGNFLTYRQQVQSDPRKDQKSCLESSDIILLFSLMFPSLTSLSPEWIVFSYHKHLATPFLELCCLCFI